MANYPIVVSYQPNQQPKWSFDPKSEVEVIDQGPNTITFTKHNLENVGTFNGIKIYSDSSKSPASEVFDSSSPYVPTGTPFSAEVSSDGKTLTVTDNNTAQSDTTYYYTILINDSSGHIDSKDPKIINKAPVGAG